MTSTWRAPAWTAASVFAVASPRSLWQWTLTWRRHRPGPRPVPTSAPNSARDRVPDRVRDVDRRRARLDHRLVDVSRKSCSVRDASSAENSISASGPRVSRAHRTQRTASASAWSRPMRSLCLRWMSLVAMNRCRCGRSATLMASTARCGSPSRQRASAATAIPPLVSRAIRRTASKSPGDAAGKPASMTSTLRRTSWRATSSFSAAVSPAPGACSPSRSVVSKIRTVPAGTPPP